MAGLTPALLATGQPAAGMASLSATRTATDTRQSHRLRNLFAVAQVALALVLVLGAGLLVQGMRHMVAAQKDYSPKTLLTFMINLPSSRYADAQQRRAFYEQALERLGRLGGVSARGNDRDAFPIPMTMWRGKISVWRIGPGLPGLSNPPRP